MKKYVSANQSTYTPQAYKSFEGALEAFFATECPQYGGIRTRQVLVGVISEMVRQFYPATTNMRAGQITWSTVHKEEKASYGKTIQQTRLVPVILDLVQSQDALDRAKGRSLREIKKEAIARIFTQAYEQEGCMTNAEIAILLKMAPCTVSKYVASWEKENDMLLPRRGTIHDLGPTLTHKRIIVEKLFLEQKTVQQVGRETHHSANAIQRYISNFKQVLLCRMKKMSIDEIAYSVGLSRKLVMEYYQLIEDFLAKNYNMKLLLEFEAHQEPKGVR